MGEWARVLELGFGFTWWIAGIIDGAVPGTYCEVGIARSEMELPRYADKT